MSRWMPVGDLLRVAAYMYPDKLGARDLYRAMTFQEWNERCCRLGNALLDLGLKKGDKVAVIAYNSVEWMEIYGATAKTGIICVPIMFRMPPAEYHYILENSEAKAFIVAGEFVSGVNTLKDKIPGIPSGNYIFFGGPTAPDGYLHYEDLIKNASPDEPPVKVNHEDIWIIMYTSGTTGKPKGVVRSHESLIAQYLTNIAELGFTRDDTGLLVMPMCHINSIYYSFVFTYTYGAVCVYNMISFDPEHLLKTLSEMKITFTSLVPTHYIMMLALPDEVKNQYDVSAIHKLMCSSAPVRKDTKLAIMEYFKNSQLFEAYGSTEAGLVTLLRPEDQLKKLGSIGREIVGTDQIKILDDTGQEVPVGQVGELYSKTPMVFNEYWKLPETTKEAFRGEYFSAGDMAYKDEEGFYTLVDRKKNMIITGGENVYPSEVENVIGSHPKVKDVAVIGIPDAKWGESVKAVVILHAASEGSPDLAQELMDYCKDKIAGYKKPKTVDFIKEEEMPRTGTGKILHRELRVKYGKWSDQK
ncbi:MAG: AMP-binding protein [Deltaproteobacteria bacterium]|nr:AMP-binding protein [Deltaproteobacteria bacterium]